MKKTKEPKISPFAKLRAQSEEYKRQAAEWRDKYRSTSEGRLEAIESALDDLSRQIEDTASESRCCH